MIEISNRHYDMIIAKLPGILSIASKFKSTLSLRECNDIRQMYLMHQQLKKRINNNKKH
jgi:hypothetical protein